MTTKFEQLLDKKLGSARLHKDEWNLAANNVDILTETDLRYFCRLAQVKNYSRMKRVEKIAALQPFFDKHNVNKVEVKQEVKEVKKETKKQAKQEVKKEVKKEVDKKTARTNRSKLHNWQKVVPKEYIKPIKANTNNSKVILFMFQNNGISLDDFKTLGLPSKRQISQSIAVISEKGYGVICENNVYTLLLPDGLNAPLIKAI